MPSFCLVKVRPSSSAPGVSNQSRKVIFPSLFSIKLLTRYGSRRISISPEKTHVSSDTRSQLGQRVPHRFPVSPS